jgi:hypothetical protein
MQPLAIPLHRLESVADAVAVAKEILTGEMDAHLGCEVIDAICHNLDYPPTLQPFSLLLNDHAGNENARLSSDDYVSDILTACDRLIASYRW